MLYNGQPSRYAQRLREDYGEAIIDTLEGKRQLITKDFPYEERIKFYTEKFAELNGESIINI